MISSLLKRKILKYAKDNRVQVPENYLDILYSAEKIEQIPGEKIVFSWVYTSGALSLSASAMLPHYIVCNAGWAVRLIFYNDESTWNAFRFTIGYELIHKDGDYFFFPAKIKESKFMLQTAEIHADFGAAEKMADCSRQKLLDSIRYKKALKKVDRGDFIHPSWKRREYYAENFNFDEKLIRQIAKDVGCSNEKLIEKVGKYYKKIVLK